MSTNQSNISDATTSSTHVSAAKTSKLSLNKSIRLRNTIRELQVRLVRTSTPKSNTGESMEHFFTNHEMTVKPESYICNTSNVNNINISMDYDSGYISHNPESNSNYSLAESFVNQKLHVSPVKPIYLSEDALLEQPEINNKSANLIVQVNNDNFEETRRLFNTPESLVNPSVPSVKTEFSGFNDSDQSNSFEIFTADEIVFKEISDELTDPSNISNNDFTDTVSNILLDLDKQDLFETEPIGEQETISKEPPPTEQVIKTPSKTLNEQTEIKSTNFHVKETPKKITVLNDVTNLLLKSTEKSSKKIHPSNKENIFDNNKTLKIIKTPKKIFKTTIDPNYSPDLFDDAESISGKETNSNVIPDEKYIIKKDHRLLKRVHYGLNGVLPPPSVTMVQMSASDILSKIEANREYFWTGKIAENKTVDEKITSPNTSTETATSSDLKSLLLTIEGVENHKEKKWPDVLEYRYHGLHYNRSKLSEEFELLCDKFARRCIGAETQSTCTVFENTYVSPTKRKSIKQRWAVKSPGRRLSHLAKRRITFSSANLQAGSSSMVGNRARQILVDAKKLDLLSRRKSPRKSPRKTPKKTPGKSPRCKTRTPSSSAKKKLAMRFRKLAGEFESSATVPENLTLSSKRALFQSPSRSKFLPSTSGLSTSFEGEVKKIPPKRALFLSPHKNSPRKNSPFKRSPFGKSLFKGNGFEKKRKRSESSEDTQPAKLSRSMSYSLDVRPSGSEVKNLNRSRSEMCLPQHTGELSAIHKKKLQWAVYEALRSQNVLPAHPQFKLFASVLARVTRRFLPNLSGNAPRPEGGTSDRMLRIARHHVFAVVKGKSVDEIISEYLKARSSKTQKPQGYVGLEEFNNMKNSNKENVSMNKVACSTGNERRRSLLLLDKANLSLNENKIDRIKKVINFGDDDNR